MRPLSYQHPEMPQAYADIPFIPKQPFLHACGCLKKGQNRLRWDDMALCVQNAEQRSSHKLGRDTSPCDRQVSTHQAIFSVQQLDDVFKQPSGQRQLIKYPALDTEMGGSRLLIRETPGPIPPRDQTNVLGEATTLTALR
jgi:hypothetical protein